ncbi:DUF2125 domain-containing protein [Labrenzia sp. OB1]|uniref:DUF2125 domain-containing protein n=1 Tax=Labrenzia sp. OB1 TaxID=1561204 RepID=UPI0007B2FC45|nr:DUF2125 domain-containing protein [Labrenzia sp. OB1]KZM51132.1 hypothetical protein OA90_05570 [Labrenzia sp. OB1]
MKKSTKSTKRRYIFLLAAVVLVTAGWSAAWVYGRSVLADQLDLQLTRMAGAGLVVSCADLAIRGYPFRYEVSCTDMRSRDRDGTAASLGGLHAVALVYNPRHVIFEAKTPAALISPMTGVSGNIAWETGRASLKFRENALGELNAVVRKPEAAIENAVSAGVFSAEKAEVHIREAPDLAGALDGYVSIDALKLVSLPDLLDTVDLRGSIRIVGGTVLLAGADLATLVRMNGEDLPVRLDLLEASMGSSSVSSSGEILVHGDGTLSGSVALTLGNATALLQSLKPLFPPKDQTFALLESFIGSLKTAQSADGVALITLPVKIDRGAASVGFMPLGRIPALFPAGM